MSPNALLTAAPHVDSMLAVDEDAIATAILRLVEVEKVVGEGGGAVGLAAIAQGLCPELIGETCVLRRDLICIRAHVGQWRPVFEPQASEKAGVDWSGDKIR